MTGTSPPVSDVAPDQPPATPTADQGILEQAKRSAAHKFVADFMTSVVKGTPQDLEKVTYLGHPRDEFARWAGDSDNRKAAPVWDRSTGDREARRRTQMLQTMRECSDGVKSLNLDLSELEIVEIRKDDDIKVVLAIPTHSVLVHPSDRIETPRGSLCFDAPRFAVRPKIAGRPAPRLPPEGTPLHRAAEDGDVETVRKLLTSGADINSLETQDGESPLHRAITRVRTAVAKLLIDSGADLNLGRRRDGQTPLQMAEGRQRVEITQLLRAKGASSRRVTRTRSPKLSPFSRVSCREDSATVTYNGVALQLVSLNGLPIKQILDYCKKTYGGRWEKRFAEDLVEVLVGMGQEVGTTCSLVLEDATGKVIKVANARMTRELRQAVWRARQGQPRSAVPVPFNRAVALSTLEKLKRTMKERWAYFQAGETGFDGQFAAAERQAASGHFDGAKGLVRFQVTVARLIGSGIDGHARIEVAGLAPLESRHLPFLVRPLDDRYVAFKPDRSGFLEPDSPYITHLGGEAGTMFSIDSLVERLAPFSPNGSLQYRKHQALRLLRRLDLVETLLDIELGDRLRVALQQEVKATPPGSPRLLSASGQFPTYGSFPRHPSRLIDGRIGYLRIASMNEQAVAEIREWMPRFRDSAGLIVDVRGNGGGRRTSLLALADFLVGPEEPPVVVNAAKYRLHSDLPQNHLANRFLFPVSSAHWNQVQRDAIARFERTFRPRWTPAANQFSDWHYLVLSHQSRPDTFHFDKPVVVLMDDRCFSATDVFLAGLKQLDGVTLMGTPSGGGSARSVSFDLGAARVRLASMASFQPDGQLFDGNGVQPDKVVEATPEFFIGGTDAVLASAVQFLAE